MSDENQIIVVVSDIHIVRQKAEPRQFFLFFWKAQYHSSQLYKGSTHKKKLWFHLPSISFKMTSFSFKDVFNASICVSLSSSFFLIKSKKNQKIKTEAIIPYHKEILGKSQYTRCPCKIFQRLTASLSRTSGLLITIFNSLGRGKANLNFETFITF